MGYRKKRLLVTLRKIYKVILHSIGVEYKKELDSIQETTYLNIRKILSKEDSKLFVSPETSLCYVEWKDYLVKFNTNSATITNGKFSYYVWLPIKKTDDLKKMFNSVIESRIKVSEASYNSNTLKNLRIISNELK